MARFMTVLLVALVLVEVGAMAESGSASNDDPGQTFTRRDTWKPDDVAGEDGDTNGGGDDHEPTRGDVRVPCSWQALPTTQDHVDALNVLVPVLVGSVNAVLGDEYLAFDAKYYLDVGVLHQWNGVRGRFEQYQRANCDGATDLTEDEARGYRWVEVVEPSPTILVDDVVLVVEGLIQAPRSAINPPSEVPVNLGLWLAVDDTEPIVAEGRLGPLWARGTATLASTTFDPGNGDSPVTCTGGGSPLPASEQDTVDEGPCGYTYTSLDDVRGDLAITLTTHWEVTWETSGGDTSGGPVETLSLSSTVPYDVYEIQTVGGS